MIRQVTQVNWGYIGDAIPSFVAMIFIPFSYSVAYGLIAYVNNQSHPTIEKPKRLTMNLYRGLFVYTTLNGMIGLVTLVTRGGIVPHDYDLKEYWSLAPKGRQPWLIRAVTHRGRWWGDQHARNHQGGMELGEESDASIAAESRIPSSLPADEKNGNARIQSPERAVLPH